jgi:hypothetical protein
MAILKVGDKARLIHVRLTHPAIPDFKVGAIVRVVGSMTGPGALGLPAEYQVKTQGMEAKNVVAGVMGWQLEPLAPELGSWEEVRRLTNWGPEYAYSREGDK